MRKSASCTVVCTRSGLNAFREIEMDAKLGILTRLLHAGC